MEKMELITERSEESLVNLLTHIKDAPASWVCVHLQMASLNDQKLDDEGLSLKLLTRIKESSLRLAKRICQVELQPMQGKTFVFEDGDIVALFLCDDHSYKTVMEKLAEVFNSEGLGHLLAHYAIEDKLSVLMAFSRAKKETAIAYDGRKKAVAMVEDIFNGVKPNLTLRTLLHTKRQHRVATVVLIIEDDLVTRGILTAVLQKQCQVVQAKDARAGIAAYITHAPNLVFLDIHLPDYNGKEVLEKLKLIDPAAHVIMLSSDSVEKNITSTHSHGAAGFVKKPFSKEIILECLNDVRGKTTLPPIWNSMAFPILIDPTR